MSSNNGNAQHVASDRKMEQNNFLAAYHMLKFSKQNENHFEVADIERRSLATKYLTAKLFDAEDTATLLLEKSLENYYTMIGDKEGVNNYWKQIKSQLSNVKNNPLEWKSELDDVAVALNFIKPLPCQETNTLSCKKKSYDDRDIEKLINQTTRKEESLERNRKIPSQVQAKMSKLQVISSQGISENKILIRSNSEQNKTINFSSISRNENRILMRSNSEQNKSRHDRNIFSENKMVRSNSEQNEPTRFTNISRSHFNHVNDKQKASKAQLNVHNLSYQNLDKFVQRMPAKSVGNDYNNTTKNLHKSTNYVSRSKLITPSQCSNAEDTKAQKNTVGSLFKSAKEELSIQEMKNGRAAPKKTLGSRMPVNSKFVCPFKRDKEKIEGSNNSSRSQNEAEEPEDERLRNIDPNMIELIKNEIIDSGKSVMWDDIAGLEYTKKIIKEVVVFPMLRPDIFTGLRRPPKGILLFGPPGTGKTLIGKCIASQSKSTFFSISASSLTSKWIGEGEKMVRALFAVARVYQPSVVFIDEIDSLLTQRSETEHESSRRLKTEFLVQLDGAATADEDRILIVGATNRPQELDEAARRRLVKRLYVPLPEQEARKQIISNLLASVQHNLEPEDITRIAERTAGYSGADMTNLCKEASMEPIRSIPFSQLEDIGMEEVRHITSRDFDEALINVRPSVSQSDLNIYIEWDRTYGSGTAQSYNA